jgi:hypothetical protein
MSDFGIMHDTWLARHRRTVETAWCENTACPNHREPIDVNYEEEYGQGWIVPEDCPRCHHELTLDEPPDIEENDDE